MITIPRPRVLPSVTALVVTDGGEHYAVPQASVSELVRLSESDVRAGLDRIGDVVARRLGGERVPLMALRHEIQNEAPADAPADHGSPDGMVLVLGTDDLRFGLLVDDVTDRQEIVVKPLCRRLPGASIFAGMTKGNGQLMLTLDVSTLAKRARRAGSPASVSADHETQMLALDAIYSGLVCAGFSDPVLVQGES